MELSRWASWVVASRDSLLEASPRLKLSRNGNYSVERELEYTSKILRSFGLVLLWTRRLAIVNLLGLTTCLHQCSYLPYNQLLALTEAHEAACPSLVCHCALTLAMN